MADRGSPIPPPRAGGGETFATSVDPVPAALALTPLAILTFWTITLRRWRPGIRRSGAFRIGKEIIRLRLEADH